MKRIVRNGSKNVLGRRLKRRRITNILGMLGHLKEAEVGNVKEHIRFWYAPFSCIMRMKNRR